MNATTQVREFSRRDSATTMLKKLGVARESYAAFIEPVNGEDGAPHFLVNVDSANLHVIAMKAPAGRLVHGKASCAGPDIDDIDDIDESSKLAAELNAKATLKTIKAKKAPAEAKPKARSVTSVALELIRAGKSNADVWTAIQTEFKLDDGKRGYPAWYRRHLRVAKNEIYPEPKAAE